MPRAWCLGLLLLTTCAPSTRPSTGASGERPAVVSTAVVTRRDVVVRLGGLGNVVSPSTVTVRPQVEGRLDAVRFVEGQDVRQGALLAVIDPRPFRIALSQAEATLARDTAQLRNAQLNVQRNTALRQEQLVAEQVLTDLQAQVDGLAATVAADRAARDSAQLQLDYAFIRAPVAGRTGVRLVDAGNLVRAADSTGLVVITQMDPIAVLFALPEDDLPQVVAQMQHGTMAVEAYARDGNQLLGRGTLGLIDNQINQASGTLRLKAVFQNPARALWPNQFVKVQLVLQTLPARLGVPAAAVQYGPLGAFVYQVEQGTRARVRPVTVGLLQDDWAEIEAGLAEGDIVVRDGQYKLHDGSAIARDVAAAPTP